MPDMPWFRVYSEILDDRKIKRVSKITGQPKVLIIGVWVTLLAIASKSRDQGSLVLAERIPYTMEDIEDETGLPAESITPILEAFRELGMVDGSELLHITNWDRRQFRSDSSTVRTRQYRERHNETSQERHGDALDTDTDTDTESEQSRTEQNAGAGTQKIFYEKDIPALLMRTVSMPSLPPKEFVRIQQILDLVHTYGLLKVEDAMKRASIQWMGRKTKDNRPYQITNMAWMDWAQEILMGSKITPGKPVAEMTSEEFYAQMQAEASDTS